MLNFKLRTHLSYLKWKILDDSLIYLATKWQNRLAVGASPRKSFPNHPRAPKGRQRGSIWTEKEGIDRCRPSGALVFVVLDPVGSRPRLNAVAASRLFDGLWPNREPHFISDS